MKALLGGLVILGIFATSCNAQCHKIFPELLPDTLSDNCMDSDGNKHPLNSHWEKNCERCTCGKTGIECCSKALKPVGYDQSKCRQIFHPGNCTYSVVEQKNPEKACTVKSWTL